MIKRFVFVCLLGLVACKQKQNLKALEWDDVKDKYKQEVFICISPQSNIYHLKPHCKALNACTKILLSTDEKAEENEFIRCEIEK